MKRRRKCGCDDINDGKCVCDICQKVNSKAMTQDSARQETWKPVLGYEGIYSVSSHGKLRRETTNTSVKSGRITKGCKDKHYMKISLRKNGIKKHESMHVAVAEAFLGRRPFGMYVNHIDGNKLNNHISNLEYVTPKENIFKSVIAGTHPKGSRIAQSKLTENDIPKIRSLLQSGKSCAHVGRIFGMSRTGISDIKHNKVWKHVK